MNASAFPLSWPDKFPRQKYPEKSRFKVTRPAATKNVHHSLKLFAQDSGKKLEDLVISSNVMLGASSPADKGVAVWFTWDGIGVCIPVDRYTKVEDNLQAIHHIIEARRVELRHGTLELVRASFTGFVALPAPKQKDWWEVLGVPQYGADIGFIRDKYRTLAATFHPDKGGDPAVMAEINEAWRVAQL